MKKIRLFITLVWDIIAWTPYNINAFFHRTRAEKKELLKSWNDSTHEIKSAHGKNPELTSHGVLPVIGYRKLIR